MTFRDSHRDSHVHSNIPFSKTIQHHLFSDIIFVDHIEFKIHNPIQKNKESSKHKQSFKNQHKLVI